MVLHLILPTNLSMCHSERRSFGRTQGTRNRAEVTCKKCLASLAKSDARKAAKAARAATTTTTPAEEAR